MITRRVQTRIPSAEPSVGFYRTIALSIFGVIVVVVGGIGFFTLRQATITILTKVDAKKMSATLFVGGEARGDQSLPGSVTTVPWFWSEKYYPTGTKSTSGIATGQVMLYNKTHANQVLIKTTRLLSKDGVLFHLADRITVPALGSVAAQVYADQPGGESDIMPSSFTIPGLSADKQQVIFAESTESMSGGSRKIGTISADDIATAKADFKRKAANAYRQSLVSGETAAFVVSVINEQSVVNRNVGEEASDFTISGSSTVAVVSYNPAQLKDLAIKQFGGAVDQDGEKVIVLGQDPAVSLSSYDVNKKTAEITVSQDATVTLDVDGGKISPEQFVGKRKEEIERSILQLDHVTGAEVVFFPSWINAAPSMASRIKIVVKKVE